MKLILQISIIFAICLLGEGISMILPIPFPSSVISMIILFIFLLLKWLKVDHIKEKTEFLLQNMAFFFIPAGVKMMENFDVLKTTFVPFLLICLVSTVVTFVVTAYTVQATTKLQEKRRNEGIKHEHVNE